MESPMRGYLAGPDMLARASRPAAASSDKTSRMRSPLLYVEESAPDRASVRPIYQLCAVIQGSSTKNQSLISPSKNHYCARFWDCY